MLENTINVVDKRLEMNTVCREKLRQLEKRIYMEDKNLCTCVLFTGTFPQKNEFNQKSI
jgi:hypothetical protein